VSIENVTRLVGRATPAPGTHLAAPFPAESPELRVCPTISSWRRAKALIEAQRLLDETRPFHAHEVLEATWKAAPEGERDLWQGLAQLAVGLTHALRGNKIGAVVLLRRGADRISGYGEEPPHGVDVTGLLDWATALAGQLDDPTNDAGPPTVPRLLGT